MLTRKHFRTVAEILKEAREDYAGGTPTELVLDYIENYLADFLATQNPNFDRERFLRACGL